MLNKELLSRHPDKWTDADIERRSAEMVKALCGVWPGPSVELQTAAMEAAAAPADAELPTLPWTDEDVARLANQAGQTPLIVLDTLSTEPGQSRKNSDFVEAGFDQVGVRGAGALTVKVHSSFGRSNVPVNFAESGGTWVWSVSEDFAARWKSARASAGHVGI